MIHANRARSVVWCRCAWKHTCWPWYLRGERSSTWPPVAEYGIWTTVTSLKLYTVGSSHTFLARSVIEAKACEDTHTHTLYWKTLSTTQANLLASARRGFEAVAFVWLNEKINNSILFLLFCTHVKNLCHPIPANIFPEVWVNKPLHALKSYFCPSLSTYRQ